MAAFDRQLDTGEPEAGSQAHRRPRHGEAGAVSRINTLACALGSEFTIDEMGWLDLASPRRSPTPGIRSISPPRHCVGRSEGERNAGD